MAGKQIIDLSSADSFDDGDLMLIRKSGMGVDRKITYADLIESIGNPAIDGYVATPDEEQENKIILKAANNAPVYKYYNGMKISFVSPIKSSGVVQIRVGNLGYKNLYRYKSDISVSVEENDYVEAVMIGEHFYQVNDLKTVTTIYTNDYVVIFSEVANGGVLTDLTLVSAYGLRKQEYYNGMSIIFTCPIDTKGAVRVNIDGLGLKDLNDGDFDLIPNDLNKNQVILAIYDGMQFVKNKFTAINPIAPSLPPEAIDIETGQVIIDSVPASNIVNISVGGSSSIKTITEAIDSLIESYGVDGGNRQATINLQPAFVWTEQVVLNKKDLSWVTIKTSAVIEVVFKSSAALYLNEGKIRIQGKFKISRFVKKDTYFAYLQPKSRLDMEQSEIIHDGNITDQAPFASFFLVNNSTLKAEHCKFSRSVCCIMAYSYPEIILNNCTFTQTVDNAWVLEISGGTLKIKDSIFNRVLADIDKSRAAHGFISLSLYNQALIENCQIQDSCEQSVQVKVYESTGTSLLTLVNNDFGQKPGHELSFQGVASGSINALIDNGKYGTVRSSQKSIVRLKNAPLVQNPVQCSGGQIIEA